MDLELGPMPFDAKAWLLSHEAGQLAPLAAKAYVYLLCELWGAGPLPATARELAPLARCTPTVFKNKIWPFIGAFFEETTITGSKKLIEPWTYRQRIELIKKLTKRAENAEIQRLRYATDKKTPTGKARPGGENDL
mgnify:CR=1 FL=1